MATNKDTNKDRFFNFKFEKALCFYNDVKFATLMTPDAKKIRQIRLFY